MPRVTQRGRRRGVFEGLPRAYYRRTGPRYLDYCVAAIVLNGVAVTVFAVVIVVLFVDLSAGELALFAACAVAGYLAEGAVAGAYLRRVAAPARAWLGGERGEDATLQAWSAAARVPLALVRRRSLYAIGAVGGAATGLVLAAL